MSDELKLAFEIIKGPHQLEGSLMKGVAAATLIKDVGPVVIMAPDMGKLHKAFEKITSLKMIEEYTIFAIGQYKKREPIEKKVERVVFKELWWFVHPESSCCFIEYEGFTSNDGLCEPLGVAIKKTKRECQQLLSKVCKMSMSGIKKYNISENEPIPF